MSERTLGKAHKKAVEEFKALLALSAYLNVCLGAVLLFKSAVLREAGDSYAIGAPRWLRL
jgi:hypothetical protein